MDPCERHTAGEMAHPTHLRCSLGLRRHRRNTLINMFKECINQHRQVGWHAPLFNRALLTNAQQQYECEFPPCCKKQNPFQDWPHAPYPTRLVQQKSFSPGCVLVYGLAFCNSQPETKTLYRPAKFDKSCRNAFCRYENLNPSKSFFFLCLTKRIAVTKDKIKHNKAKQKKKKSKHLCLHSDVTATHCIPSRGLGLASDPHWASFSSWVVPQITVLPGFGSLQKQPRTKCPDAGRKGSDKAPSEPGHTNLPLCVQSSVDLSI